MDNNKQIDPRRPIPASGYDRLRDNISANVTVLGQTPPETRPNLNRGDITSRKDDTVQDVSIGIQDHDEEFHAVVVPDFIKLQYTCTIWTDYIAQMNKLIETINYASDAYWGDKERFKFNAKIDTFSNTTEVQQGDNRVIKTDFGLTLQGYLVPDSINKELAKKPQKSFSKSTVKFNTEVVSTFDKPKTREQIRITSADPNSSNSAEANEAATYGSLSVVQNILPNGIGVGYQTIGSTINHNTIT